MEPIDADMDALARTLRLLHRYIDEAPADLPAQVVGPDDGRRRGRAVR